MLRAAGDDTWNVVNFVNVETPRGDQVQFRANVVLKRRVKALEALGRNARIPMAASDVAGLSAVQACHGVVQLSNVIAPTNLQKATNKNSNFIIIVVVQ